MPYLTPESVPAATTARTLFIPDSPEWVSLVNGALLELCQLSNWEQSAGGISPDDAVIAAIAIFESMQVSAGDVMQIGMVTIGLFQTSPAGWLPLDGGNYLMSDYPELMEVYPTVFQNTPSAGRFSVPDMSGRVPLQTGPGYPMFATGGAATHTLTISEMPSHSHGTPVGAGYNINTSRAAAWDGSDPLGEIPGTAQGGGASHNNMQPYIALGFYLVAKNG